MEGDVLHMMGPYQERISAGTSSEVVVPDKTAFIDLENSEKTSGLPRVLDDQAQVVVPGKFDGLLDVLRGSRVDADYRYAPLLTRDAERGVEVAALDGPVRKGVRLVVDVFGGTRLVRTPDTAAPVGEDISTVSCGRVVARGGRWDWVDERLRDL